MKIAWNSYKKSVLMIMMCWHSCFAVAGAHPRTVKKTDHTILKEKLIVLEKQSWQAWKDHDGKFFDQFLSEDHIDINAGGIINKKNIINGVASGVCLVTNFSVDNFNLVMLNSETALLTYHAAQQTTCGSIIVPSPVWVSSLYMRRHGVWKNVLFQQTPTAK